MSRTGHAKSSAVTTGSAAVNRPTRTSSAPTSRHASANAGSHRAAWSTATAVATTAPTRTAETKPIPEFDASATCHTNHPVPMERPTSSGLTPATA